MSPHGELALLTEHFDRTYGPGVGGVYWLPDYERPHFLIEDGEVPRTVPGVGSARVYRMDGVPVLGFHQSPSYGLALEVRALPHGDPSLPPDLRRMWFLPQSCAEVVVVMNCLVVEEVPWNTPHSDRRDVARSLLDDDALAASLRATLGALQGADVPALARALWDVARAHGHPFFGDPRLRRVTPDSPPEVP